MPVTSVHRVKFITYPEYKYEGTQYITGVLTLPTSPDTTTVYLGGDLYRYPANYVLFDYSESTEVTPLVGSISQIVLDTSDLDSPLLSGSATLIHDTVNKKIIAALGAESTVGTQYIDGVLTINSPMTITLSSDLYSVAGTYVLFDWSSSVDPTPFVGSVSNISVVPPAGRIVSSLQVVGNTITIVLI
jgi:hypothetical protein